MTPELARRKLDYWMEKLNLYEHCEVMLKAETYPEIKRLLKRLGHKTLTREQLRLANEQKRNTHTQYIDAADCWSPPYRGGKVAITWSDKQKRISVWGSDDIGMEKGNTTKEEYNRIIAMSPISQKMLREIGFEYC